jgi:two-component system chemotaxis response regulator CheY
VALRILVIDDSDISRVLIREMAASLGHTEIFEANSMQTALEGYSEHKPDVVTLDLSMPGEDGSKVLGALRKLDPKAKIIIISGNSQKKMKKKLIAAGAACALEKPLRLPEFKSALAPFLNAPKKSETGEKEILEIISEGIDEAVDKLAIMSRAKWKVAVNNFSAGVENSFSYADDFTECYGIYAGCPGTMFLLVFPKSGGSDIAKAFIFGHENAIAALPDAEEKALCEVANIFIGKVAAVLSDRCEQTQLINVPILALGTRVELMLKAFGDYTHTGRIFTAHIHISSERMSTDCNMLIFLDTPVIDQLLKAPETSRL